MKQGCRVTPGRGNPRESATEKSLPHRTGNGSGVMVKRWGKGPPRTWQQGRHGKPHPEQCRIGASGGRSGNGRHRRDASARRPGLAAKARRQRRDQRNGHPGGFGPRTEPGLQAVRAFSFCRKRGACSGAPAARRPRGARPLAQGAAGGVLQGRNRSGRVQKPCRPHGRPDGKAGHSSALALCAPWRGPSPLPQHCADPCPAGGQSPRPAPAPPPAGASPPPGRALASVSPGPSAVRGTLPCGRGKRGSRFRVQPKRASPFPGSGGASRQAGGRIAVSAPCPSCFPWYGQAAPPRSGQDGAFAVDSAVPADKRRASRISPGAAVPGLLEKRPWPNRRLSRFV